MIPGNRFTRSNKFLTAAKTSTKSRLSYDGRITWLKFTLEIFAELQFTRAPDSHAAAKKILQLPLGENLSHFRSIFLSFFEANIRSPFDVIHSFSPSVDNSQKRSYVRFFGTEYLFTLMNMGRKIWVRFWVKTNTRSHIFGIR